MFQQLNDIIKRELTKEIKNDTLSFGDQIKSQDGKLEIDVQQFSFSQGFPIVFMPQDKDILDDKDIITLLSDFDGSSEYVIKKHSSKEDSSEELKEAEKTSTTTKKTNNSPKSEKPKNPKIPEETTISTPSSSTTTNKHEKLLKDIAEEPVILTHI